MQKYLIIKEETCPACHGHKYVINPIWAAFIATITDTNGKVNLDEFDRRVDETFGNILPAEEEPCVECDARGLIRTEVNLADALVDLKLIMSF